VAVIRQGQSNQVAGGKQMKASGQRRRDRKIGEAGILFEDADLIVLDKPAGLLAVPIPGSRARNLKGLVDAYLAPVKQKAEIVHRIDRYTSGVMVFAKNRTARHALVEQFRELTPQRVYWALVRGRVEPAEDEMRHFLKLTSRGFRQVVVSGRHPGGTPALARYRVLEHLSGVTLLEVRLVTGLKNQIRVQLGALGYPLVGDRHYAASEKKERAISRQALHDRSLGFLHPRTQQFVSFEAPPARDFEQLLRTLRRPA
jgi:23S rRNA pseudouridine1911/1915/1917 synthase